MTSKKQHHADSDAVTRYLQQRGVSDALLRLGLPGMIDAWLRIATGAAQYDLTLDDWLNDLDLRDIIADALAVAPDAHRDEYAPSLARADDAFRAATRESEHALSTSLAPDVDETDAAQRWWYFRYPSDAGETLRSDLLNEGML